MAGTIDNLPDRLRRIQAARFVEDGAGTYNWDVFIPAYAIIEDVGVYAEALWTAATSAALVCGTFAHTNGAIGSAIDADGFIASTDLKATDLLADESLTMAYPGGLGGAFLPTDFTAAADLNATFSDTEVEGELDLVAGALNGHVTDRMAAVDRWVRFTITSVGAGTAGRTVCWVSYSRPVLTEVTQ